MIGEDSQEVSDQVSKGNIAKQYFTNLFTSMTEETQPVLEHVQNNITEVHNDILLRLYTISEFKKALFSMHSDKALGPNGINPAFFKNF